MLVICAGAQGLVGALHQDGVSGLWAARHAVTPACRRSSGEQVDGSSRATSQGAGAREAPVLCPRSHRPAGGCEPGGSRPRRKRRAQTGGRVVAPPRRKSFRVTSVPLTLRLRSARHLDDHLAVGACDRQAKWRSMMCKPEPCPGCTRIVRRLVSPRGRVVQARQFLLIAW